MKTNLKKINTKDDCFAILHNGKVVSSSEGSNFSRALYFDNDVTYSNTSKSFLQCNCDSFENNQISISLWIAPTKSSKQNAPIVTNETGDGLTGLFLNANGDESILGSKWNDNYDSSVVNLEVTLEKDTWTHLVVSFNKNGIIDIFKNGIYENRVNTKIENDFVKFENVKIGGFCGYIDDFNFYPKTIKFGDVKLKSKATHNVAYLFHKSRITGHLINPDLVEETEDFYYIQSDEYVEAYENYKIHLENKHPYYEDSAKYNIDGGINDGNLKVANGSFRTFKGKIVSESL